MSVVYGNSTAMAMQTYTYPNRTEWNLKDNLGSWIPLEGQQEYYYYQNTAPSTKTKSNEELKSLNGYSEDCSKELYNYDAELLISKKNTNSFAVKNSNGWMNYNDESRNTNIELSNYNAETRCYQEIKILNGKVKRYKDESKGLDVATKQLNGRRPANGKDKKKANNGFKHIPHKDKPPQVVAKRNARERRRVQAVNKAFVRLRQAVPIENKRGKRISKVKTLHFAIEYIQILKRLLEDNDNIQYTIPNSYNGSSYLPNNNFMCQKDECMPYLIH